MKEDCREIGDERVTGPHGADEAPLEAPERGDGTGDGRAGVAAELERRGPPQASRAGDAEADIEAHGAALLRDRRRVAAVGLAVVLLIVGIYVVLPKVVGLHDTLNRLGHATWYWVVIAVVFLVVSFLAYAALFTAVLGGRGERADDPVRRRLDLRASYQITMAGFAATKLFSAAGAGGVALTYWALRKAGMRPRIAVCRMVAFLVLLYAVYLGALVVFGALLYSGVLPGRHPTGGTIVPAAIAFAVLVVLGLVALIPGGVERGISTLEARTSRWARWRGQLAQAPGTIASGVRVALGHLRHPHRSAGTLLGALGWWAGTIGILWASFESVGVHVPFGVIVQGFFVGMSANLLPSPAAGVGTVDAGMIGAFVLFGIPAATVFPAVLVFRLVSFWLPIPVGVWAFVQLRRTIHAWAGHREAATIQSEVRAEAT